MRKALIILMTLWATVATAQVGEYRTDFALGLNGGYVMSNMAFVPKVPQTMLGGMTFGVTARYTSCIQIHRSRFSIPGK